MTQRIQIGGDFVEVTPDHLGGTTVVPNGGTVNLALPTGTGVVYFKAEGGAAYYNVNVASAGTASFGYIASGGNDMIFKCGNLGTVNVFAAAGVSVHTQYYSS